jgi:hypothetical protein
MRWWLTIACTSVAVGFAWLAGASGAGADPWKTTARYALEYRVHLADLAPSGTKARLWVPYPAANRDQKILDAQIESPWPWKLHTDRSSATGWSTPRGSRDRASPTS